MPTPIATSDQGSSSGKRDRNTDAHSARIENVHRQQVEGDWFARPYTNHRQTPLPKPASKHSQISPWNLSIRSTGFQPVPLLSQKCTGWKPVLRKVHTL